MIEYTMKISTEEVREILDDIFANYPEYTSGSCFKCLKYDYKNFIFIFLDIETGIVYEVNFEKAEKGFAKFIALWHENPDKRIFGITDLFDSAEYDAEATDVILQLSIFGEIRYG